ncbi:hypothetical protein [Microbulbifer sp. YPW16]|uniref:hypothetical protein n=1 Tax=Microbulbifer sp. YPW16 TaxID=2904242 RepID=UPI001E3B1CEE|nr:hypothetical protein [Microbulbifer sp. YPW16]UHQ55919.1 hypothetical protein LVE68_02735 [Microbulbifer sp. YPW16]
MAVIPIAAAAGHLASAAFGAGEISVEPAFALLTVLASAIVFVASYWLYGWSERANFRHAPKKPLRRLASPVLWMPMIIVLLAAFAHLLNQS